MPLQLTLVGEFVVGEFGEFPAIQWVAVPSLATIAECLLHSHADGLQRAVLPERLLDR